VIVNVGYCEAPVAWEAGNGSFSNNAPVTVGLLRQGDPGPQGPPGPTAVSADTGNKAILGSDGLIFVP
jgi:hypothetical protein